MQVAVDARYLCEPFGSMTVFCSGLLEALASMKLDAPPAALVPRDLHRSAVPLAEHLGETVTWVRPPKDRYGKGRLRGEFDWVQRDIPQMITRQLPSAEVVLMPYHHPPARIGGVRRVVFVHDLCGLGEGFPKHKKNFWRHYLRLRAATHLADQIWPVSRSTSQALATRFGAATRRLGPVLYNVVDRDPVGEADLKAALEKFGLQHHGYVVAFATHQRRKNFGTSLAAMSLMQGENRPLRLVGIAPPGEADDIRQRCRQAGQPDALILSGLQVAELDALYAGALALVWPSTCEGFGYPVVEAMAQGCPALVWEVGPGAELVEGTIRPLSRLTPDHVAERLISLRRASRPDRDALAERCRERASFFAMDAYKERLMCALNNVPER